MIGDYMTVSVTFSACYILINEDSISPVWQDINQVQCNYNNSIDEKRNRKTCSVHATSNRLHTHTHTHTQQQQQQIAIVWVAMQQA